MLEARILTTFPRRENTPDFVLWEGNVIVVNPEKTDERTGRDEIVLMGQMSLLRSRDGGDPYLGFPPIRGRDGIKKNASGRAYTYYSVGPALSRIIIPVLEAAVAEADATPPTVKAAEEEFGDLAF